MSAFPHLVRRERASLTATILAPIAALAIATLINLALYTIMGRSPAAVFHAMLLEPFLSWAAFSEVLLKMGPLLLIAQGLAIGFRAKVFNIGAEGQFILGAIFASAIPVWYPAATGAGSGRPCCCQAPSAARSGPPSPPSGGCGSTPTKSSSR